MFSVVIPLYNKELSITNTVQSVLDQTCQNFEIVIINDGSTDSSVKAVEAINDNRIRLIHQENQGVSAARNRGIKEAKYEWIAFLDGDDLWHREHLEKYQHKININPSIKWVISGFTIYNGKERIEKIFNDSGKIINIFDSLLSGIVIHTSTVCVRANLFEQYNDLYFRVGLNNSEDREVWYKLACIDKSPFYLNESLSIYIVGVSGSLTSKNYNNMNDQFLEMENRVKAFTELISCEDKYKFFKFLKDFNRKALIGRYRQGTFNECYKKHLGFIEYKILKMTVFMPKYFRYLIARILCF